MKIACLHTAESNVAIFEAARPEGVSLGHAVRPDLLAAAEAEGLTPAIAAATAEALGALGKDEVADAVLLTCSTLGPAAEAAGALRADAALAEAATAGGTVEVLCTAPATLATTAELFGAAAGRTGARLTIRLVPGAWALFQAGDHAGYAALIARDAEASRADVVALAQASMAPAAQLTARPVLTVPAAALAIALAGL
ncbi:MAG: Asp/Glu racemase [Proteobacteria bacterium]|nr:Asp/Glu racemase [Pseudomonadota bacterium]